MVLIRFYFANFALTEVLDDNGNFVGFDVVIGNPPYIQLQSMGNITDAYKNAGLAYKINVRIVYGYLWFIYTVIEY
ncbi:hypothetical protein AGMMS49574_01220 [Bacteroidia bacterium]|nr:hypothetical protein AGMMS49574_01220 [Bacteroidia bacterium]GHU57456.1 hypothetical protein FACS189411_11140 [Bacteroidia bacterium]